MSLRGRTIAVSIGDSPDLAKLGFPAREVERALLSVCGALVRAGANVAYGGDFRPNGFTQQMYLHLAGAYAEQASRPFRHYLAEPVLRRTKFEDLVASLRQSHSVSQTSVFLGKQAFPIRASGATLLISDSSPQRLVKDANEFRTWLSEYPITPSATAFNIMRRAQSLETHGRVAMGGKVGLPGRPDDKYEGDLPGIVEEALLTLSAHKPFIPLAAFGGATRDVAIALKLLDREDRTEWRSPPERYQLALDQIGAFAPSLPREVCEDLRTLARLDRIEILAELIVSVIGRWLD